MEVFEFVLIILTCVVASSVLDEFSRISIPVLQVIIGLIVALILPGVQEIRIDSELFLVLFIAPLLFNETREANPAALWKNHGSILSLAIGLVIAIVLSGGFTLHLLVPSIPLAAAFAFAAALGPTDAATVTALRSSVHLSNRQRTLLSGESLINDASGVIAFQFSVAAAVTGAFSALAATQSFAVLFIGGIVVGLVAGTLFSLLMAILGRMGFDDTTAHVLYEVISPFLIYLFAELCHVSGILAVVAGGLVMAQATRRNTFISTTAARQKLVSDNFWRIISFLINGTVFVLLGMQLPRAVTPGFNGGLSIFQILGVIATMTLILEGVRFLWLLVLEIRHSRHGLQFCGSDVETGTKADAKAPAGTRTSLLTNVLVTTIAGAKGAVTLSIALTLPYVIDSGAPFPQRELIITITAGTILASLLLADALLPRLAPKTIGNSLDERLRKGEIAVLEATTSELRSMMSDGRISEKYLPALRLTISRYTSRLFFERISTPEAARATMQMIRENNELQQSRLEELRLRHLKHHDTTPWSTILENLRSIRRSVGYINSLADIGMNAKTNNRIKIFINEAKYALKRLRNNSESSEIRQLEDNDRAYFQACLYAIELEYTEIDRLEEICRDESDPDRAAIAANLLVDHQSAVDSIWSRVNIGQEGAGTDMQRSYSLPYNLDTHEISPHFRQQIADARTYANDVDENALRVELDQIARLQYEGIIDREVASHLRENVYYLQMSIGD